MKEEWRLVKVVKGVDFTGYYEISNLGNLKSLDRTVLHCDGIKQNRKGVMFDLTPSKDGYIRTILRKDGKERGISIHQLVAMAFIPNPNGYKYVNHKDENKINNRVDNLEWVSQAENNIYGTRTERASETIKNRFEPIVCLYLNGNIKTVYYKKQDINSDKNVSTPNVIMAVSKNVNIYKEMFFIKLGDYNSLSNDELTSLIKIRKAEFDKRNGHNSKKIAQIDKNGNIVKQWDSITNAARETGISRVTIRGYLNGMKSKKYDYTWQYLP